MASLNRFNDGFYCPISITFSGSSRGEQLEYMLDVNLVDSQTKEIIRYEGTDVNPHMRKVLLTHEALCRCRQNKACGHRNELPANPVVDRSSPSFLTCHVKCNQNCNKTAGYPNVMRRFRIRVASQGYVLAYSHQIFVHNNSKHKTPTKRAQVKCNTGIARLEALIPRFQGDPEKLSKEDINRAADALEQTPSPQAAPPPCGQPPTVPRHGDGNGHMTTFEYAFYNNCDIIACDPLN